MTKEEIEGLMHLTITQLRELAMTQEGFISVLSCAINFGRVIGTRQAHESMNRAFRGYTPALIKS